MPRSGRIVPEGAAYHVSSVIEGRQRILTQEGHVGIILDALAFQRRQRKIELYAYVVMPDHLHWILRPVEPHTCSAVVGALKSFTSRCLRDALVAAGESRLLGLFALGALGRADQAFRIWHPRAWMTPIVEETVLRTAIDYVHDNPVRARLVDDPLAWPWSSARWYAGLGGPIELDPWPG